MTTQSFDQWWSARNGELRSKEYVKIAREAWNAALASRSVEIPVDDPIVEQCGRVCMHGYGPCVRPRAHGGLHARADWYQFTCYDHPAADPVPCRACAAEKTGETVDLRHHTCAADPVVPIPMETITHTAILGEDGQPWTLPIPASHYQIATRFSGIDGFSAQPLKRPQGFVTSTGRYVGRKAARRIAVAAGQIKDDETYQPDDLFSEDLHPTLNMRARAAAEQTTKPTPKVDCGEAPFECLHDTAAEEQQ